MYHSCGLDFFGTKDTRWKYDISLAFLKNLWKNLFCFHDELAPISTSECTVHFCRVPLSGCLDPRSFLSFCYRVTPHCLLSPKRVKHDPPANGHSFSNSSLSVILSFWIIWELVVGQPNKYWCFDFCHICSDNWKSKDMHRCVAVFCSKSTPFLS